MKKILLFSILLILFFTGCKEQTFQQYTFNINKNWTFKAVKDTTWLSAKVPGYVHTDLMNNKIIEDPFYRLNEHHLQWIDKKDWEYKTTFVIDNDILKKDVVELIFKGLDTYAKVYLNDTLILTADNMFIHWTVDCKKHLKQGDNILKVIFESPINIGLDKREKLGYFLPGAENDQSELGGVGDKKTCVFTRKAQYHYGWDWGPRLVSSGIWKDIELKAWNKNSITDVRIVQGELTEREAKLVSEIEIISVNAEKITILGIIDSIQVFEKTFNTKKGLNQFTLPFTIQNPELWWTNGLGNQKLYSIKVEIKQGSKVISSKSQNIGLRTIEIVQQPDSTGKSFYFKLNGHPVFMKGANYIPQDIFLTRVKDKDYEALIKSAVDANFNMLRVWGGGIYEKDIFYDLCDKYGILVWQDFMFACAMYPGNKEFLDNVKMEAIQNVKRLRNHPSIALWCGDNEILSAWNRWGWKENVHKNQGQEIVDTVWKAYDDIFHHLLPEVIKEYDPQRLFWSSSPSSGFGELENGKSGDNHYWGVWWAKKPFSEYKKEIPRFMSEYGFQSFPELNSIKKYALEEDWDINSEVMKSHQRSSIGNVTITEYMKRDYHDPKDFPMFLYVNHVLQAEGIKIAIEAHRQNMPYCMGSLYWQINDCWPVASWSGIDNYGNWKAMHYFVKKAFEEILVSPKLTEDDKLEVYIISDNLKTHQAKLKLRLLDFNGNKLWKTDKKVNIEANTSKIYFTSEIDKILQEENKAAVFLNVQLVGDNGDVISENNLYFKPVKDLDLPSPNITYKVTKSKEGFKIKLKTNKLAKNLYLRANELEGHFSDNYFELLPEENITIEYKSENSISLQQFKNKLKIFTIVDTY